MELRSPGASSADDLYRIAETDEPSTFLSLGTPAARSLGGNRLQAAMPTEVTAQTIETAPVIVVVGAVDSDSSGAEPVGDSIGSTSAGDAARAESAPGSGAATSAPLGPATGPADGTAASQPSSPSNPSPNTSRTTPAARLRPKRRRRVRVRHLLQAWGVSLVVHVAILSALAAATFSARDTIKKIVNFDSALASLHGGEPELVPIYADADNSVRDHAIGEEHAETAGEPTSRDGRWRQ